MAIPSSAGRYSISLGQIFVDSDPGKLNRERSERHHDCYYLVIGSTLFGLWERIQLRLFIKFADGQQFVFFCFS